MKKESYGEQYASIEALANSLRKGNETIADGWLNLENSAKRWIAFYKEENQELRSQIGEKQGKIVKMNNLQNNKPMEK